MTILLFILGFVVSWFLLGLITLRFAMWVGVQDEWDHEDAVIVTTLWPIMIVMIIYDKCKERLDKLPKFGDVILKLVGYKK